MIELNSNYSSTSIKYPISQNLVNVTNIKAQISISL